MQENEHSNDDTKLVLNELVRLDLHNEICEMMMVNIDYILRQNIVPKFWQNFKQNDDNENGFYQFQLSVHDLHRDYDKIKRMIEPLNMIQLESNRNYSDIFDDSVKIILLSQLPANFNKIVYSFYQISFNVFANSHQDTGLTFSIY